MANIITAGNSTNGGTAISTDTSGTLNIVTGSGSGANAITIDASQNVVFSGNVSGVLKSGTAVASTSGTSIDFTSLPTGLKRITVMLNNVSTSGTSNIQIQIGSGSVETTGYVSVALQLQNAAANTLTSSTTGFIITASNAGTVFHNGFAVLSLLGSNIWTQTGNFQNTAPVLNSNAGSKTASGTLDRVRITTVNGTDTFDAGSINILFE
jgi:hypothetical protein